MKKCSVCNKNVAIAFVSKIENGKTQMRGICIECAKKLGLPIMDQILGQTGMNEEDIENLAKDMNAAFEDEDFDDDNTENDSVLNNILNNFKSLYSEEKESISDTKQKPEINENKKKSTKYLETYGTNLIDKARSNQIDKIIGRDKEIDRVIQILNRRSKNNPILIGEPGVGKTAIAEGLAVRIVEKQVPSKLFNAQIYLLDLTAIVAGTQFRGQFEGRMKSIIKEAQEHGNIILVIDEVHNIMGAGEVHGGVMNAANILKPALARGEIQIIGATTLEEYRKHIEKDAALERRFQPVIVDEPTIEESIEILKGIRSYYEDFHKVKISDEVIEAAVKLSERYITDRYLPDKAIDIIDEAGSKVNLNNHDLLELEKLKEELKDINEKREQAAIDNDYERAATYKMKECEISERIKSIGEKANQTHVTVEDVAFVIESWTKIPMQKITQEEARKLLNLEESLHKHVIGQHKAIESISKAIRRNRSGFRKKKKPSSFIFVGPTGVGKTELVRTLARELFGSEEAMISIDMSEYMEKHTVSKLIGSPPGYVGYDEGGQLTEKVRRKPYSVILLDEIEKAHPDVFNMLLQVLEDGRLTDSHGRTVSFENTVIIMTSNAGSSLRSNNIGFAKDAYEALENKAKNALKEIFRPEFLNRVDEIIVFTSLSKEELRKIIDLMLKEVEDEVKEKDMNIEVSEEVKDFILEKGYDEKYGARPLRRTIQKYIEDEIAEKYLQSKFKKGDTINVTIKEGKVVVF
ncbi:ATP-dependent Clp protease ATP-binding subunit [Alkalithermobacter paradoxus]|uniref:Negative regulator of genetic competence ClpC/MecB n=1 Tax=Alkalithermobacter paradoxus TaxID=29349 RepID=A0A1V4I5A4_9FIRM|nr:negative regulator of genetic competence ClpC/MecB [[Clostridium] thermoalcaliphilum]